MKTSIVNSMFQEEAVKEIKILLTDIVSEYKYENIISNLKETWNNQNSVTIVVTNNKKEEVNIILTITDFEMIIRSDNERSVVDFEIIIKSHLKNIQKFFV